MTAWTAFYIGAMVGMGAMYVACTIIVRRACRKMNEVLNEGCTRRHVTTSDDLERRMAKVKHLP